MNAKRTHTSGKRRTNDGKKPASQDPKITVDKNVAQSSTGDDFWQIKIIISNEDRVEIVAMIIKPVPPHPPVTGLRLNEWFQENIRGVVIPY